MKFRNSALPAICLLVLGFNAAPAHADTFTYMFSGSIPHRAETGFPSSFNTPAKAQ